MEEQFCKRPIASEKVSNFYDCIRPVYILSRLLGLFPFTIHIDSNGIAKSVEIRVFDAILFVGSIVSQLVFSCVGLYFVTSRAVGGTDSAVFHTSRVIFGFFGFVLWLLSASLDMLNRNRFLKLIQDLTVFDQNVRNKKI